MMPGQEPVLPEAVLGHVVQLAPGDLRGDEEVDEGAVHGCDDHRPHVGDASGPVDRDPEEDAVDGPHQHAQQPVDAGEAHVGAGLVRGAGLPRRCRPSNGPPRPRSASPAVVAVAHSHPTISSAMSSTVRPVVSITWAPSATPRGETAAGAVEVVAAGAVVGSLLGTPSGPFVVGGGEIDLDVGRGKDDRADVTALDHDPAVPFGDPASADARPWPAGRGGWRPPPTPCG